MPAKTHTHVIKPGGLDTSSVPANPQLGFSTPGVGNASANVTGAGSGPTSSVVSFTGPAGKAKEVPILLLCMMVVMVMLRYAHLS